MQRMIKRTKVEKKAIDEEAMNNAFNKVELKILSLLCFQLTFAHF